ncbi:hypothetical protein ACQ4PT_065034 [Festuca glaucescens]
MPELPEVEAARRALEAHCVGRRIRRCAVADDPKVVLSDRVAFERAMVGRTIVAARRRGKNLWLRLDAPPFPSFQFGQYSVLPPPHTSIQLPSRSGGPMVGDDLGLQQLMKLMDGCRSAVKSTDEWPSKYSKFFVELDDGLEFSFTDKRRFARVRLFDDPETVPPISELGPDALFEPMSVDNFVESLRKKKIGIKALLLDQSFVSGIGNWIADEVLYQSRTHPLQIASSLTRESCEALHQSIQEVVKYAVDVDADSGRFPIEWLFHHRWGKNPGKVDGKKIEFITAGGRTTAYVPQLQKLTGTQSGKAVVADPRQVSNDGDAKEAGEDDDDPKPRKRVAISRAARGKPPSRKTNPMQLSEDGGAKEVGADGDDDLKPRKRVAISRAARGKPPSRKTNPMQVSEDGGAKEVGADGDDDLKPRKRVATSRVARGQQNKDAASAPSRKTEEIAGAKKKPSIEHGSKNSVKTVESHGAGATGNNDHGLVEPSVAVHRVSDHGVARTSSRKKTKPVKYQ